MLLVFFVYCIIYIRMSIEFFKMFVFECSKGCFEKYCFNSFFNFKFRINFVIFFFIYIFMFVLIKLFLIIEFF